jgi:hypothetical protein
VEQTLIVLLGRCETNEKVPSIYIYIHTCSRHIDCDTWPLMETSKGANLGPKCIWLQRARAPCSPTGCKSFLCFFGSMAKTVMAPRPAPWGRGRRAHVSIRWLGIMHGLFRRRGRRPHAKTHTYPNGLADLAWQLPARNAFSICIYSPQSRIVLS